MRKQKKNNSSKQTEGESANSKYIKNTRAMQRKYMYWQKQRWDAKNIFVVSDEAWIEPKRIPK